MPDGSWNALVCSMETARVSMPDGSRVDVPDGRLNWRLDVLIWKTGLALICPM